tara:strand:- start:1052 stop:1357 length:306 start_codon:yes stop_codon:yes gene_type:complete
MTEEAKYLIQECKEKQEWEERYRSNHIEFDKYFKYSGKVEANKILITHWKYNEDRRCNDLHEQFIKKQEYEENKKNTTKISRGLDSYYWDETKNRIWSDKI